MKRVGTGAPWPWRVLVTGFGAFPGARTNPTAAILARLGRERARLARLGIDLQTEILPVVYVEIEPRLSAAVLRLQPDAILHLGLAGRRKAISVETRAINRAGPLHPDANGRVPGQVLARVGGITRRATYPAIPIAAALRCDGHMARISIDAGDYVCNAALYRSLGKVGASQIGFLHVPRTRQVNQPTARVRHARPTIADLTRAVVVAILTMARQRHREAAAAAPMALSTNAGREDRS